MATGPTPQMIDTNASMLSKNRRPEFASDHAVRERRLYSALKKKPEGGEVSEYVYSVDEIKEGQGVRSHQGYMPRIRPRIQHQNLQ